MFFLFQELESYEIVIKGFENERLKGHKTWMRMRKDTREELRYQWDLELNLFFGDEI